MPEIITMADLRRIGHCPPGVKSWFDAQGLDFRAFLKNGITVEEFLSTGDGIAKEAVRLIRERK